MQSVIAYLISVWCYAVAITATLWLAQHVLVRYGRCAQFGMLLLAMALVVRGNDAWAVANGAGVADYWLFRVAIEPAAVTLIILEEYSRYAAKRRKERLKRIKLLADNSDVCACAVQHLAPSGRARGETREERAIADQSGIVS